jgi:hypothetical protein
MDFLYIVASHQNSQADALDIPYLEICNSSSLLNPTGYNVYDNSYAINISSKNLAYCELSPLYSIWKNDFNYKMIGLGHYRRFINFSAKTNEHDFLNKSFQDRKAVSKNLEKYMPVLENAFYVLSPKNVGSILDNFKIHHPQLYSFFEYSFDVFQKQNPNIFNVKNFFKNSGQLSICNMFYGSRDIVDQWCNQIFNLLFELEKNVPSDLDHYQSRWAGFFAERYLSFFVSQISDKVNITYKPMIYFE